MLFCLTKPECDPRRWTLQRWQRQTKCACVSYSSIHKPARKTYSVNIYQAGVCWKHLLSTCTQPEIFKHLYSASISQLHSPCKHLWSTCCMLAATGAWSGWSVGVCFQGLPRSTSLWPRTTVGWALWGRTEEAEVLSFTSPPQTAHLLNPGSLTSGALLWCP